MRALDAAAVVLRDVARVVRNPRYRDADVRAVVAATYGEATIDAATYGEATIDAATYGEATIDAAIATVDDLARPPDDHHQREILAQYPTVRRFLPAVLRTIHFKGTASAGPLLTALAFLATLEDPHPPDMVEAPLAAIPKAWRARVVNPDDRPDYHVDRRTYMLAVLEQVQAALRRRDLFVAPSEKWADPRAVLLQGAAWEAARPGKRRGLGSGAAPDLPRPQPCA